MSNASTFSCRISINYKYPLDAIIDDEEQLIWLGRKKKMTLWGDLKH